MRVVSVRDLSRIGPSGIGPRRAEIECSGTRPVVVETRPSATKADLTDVILEQARQHTTNETPLTARLIKGIVLGGEDEFAEFTDQFDSMLAQFAERAQRLADEEPETTAQRAFPFTFTIYERPRGAG